MEVTLRAPDSFSIPRSTPPHCCCSCAVVSSHTSKLLIYSLKQVKNRMQDCGTMGSVKNRGATIHKDLVMYVSCTCYQSRTGQKIQAILGISGRKGFNTGK